jgi:hypothetical protein
MGVQVPNTKLFVPKIGKISSIQVGKIVLFYGKVYNKKCV